MAIETNPTTLGRLVTKPHFDMLYRSAILADSGGTAGGAQTIPGDKTFSGNTTMRGPAVVVSSADQVLTNAHLNGSCFVTTGASNRTITIPAASATNAGGWLWIGKVDAGAGHVVLSGFTLELWYQGDHVILASDGTAWHRVGGTGRRSVPEANRSYVINNYTTVGTSWIDKDCSALIPSGAKSVAIEVYLSLAGDGTTDGMSVLFRKNGSTQTAKPNVIEVYLFLSNLGAGLVTLVERAIEVDVDSSLVFEHQQLVRGGGGAGTGVLYGTIVAYSYD